MRPFRLLPRRRPGAATALALAGLSLFNAPGSLRAATEVKPAVISAEPAPPARRIVQAPIPSPTPSPTPAPTPFPHVKPEELKAAEARLEKALKDAAKRDEERALTAEAMQRELETRLKEADARIDTLDKGRLEGVTRGDELSLKLKDFDTQLEASRKKLEQGLVKVEEVRSSIESKGEKLEGVLDVLNALKRDVSDSAHEIAELKRGMKELEARLKPGEDEADWWAQIVSWRYLPVVAVVLGAAALGVAASKR